MGKKNRCAYKKCKKPVSTGEWCRIHYMIQSVEKYKKLIKSKERMLDGYIEALTKKYPNRYLEVIKKDLENPENFKRTLKGLQLNMPQTTVLQNYYEALTRFKK